MALLTIPTTPEKGVAQSYSLNLTDLFSLVTNSYYTTQSNISKIIVLYVSATGNQLENINFIPDGVSTTINSSALFASQALNFFEVAFIAIVDKQNGRYVIKASQIPNVINYSILFSSGNGAGVSYALGSGGSSSAFTSFIDSENNFYSSVGYYGGVIGGPYIQNVLMDTQANTIDYTISNSLNNVSTGFVCLNNDLTKAYAIGAYNGVYGSSTFSAPSQYNYNQLIEIDTATGSATLITQLEPTVFSTSRIGSIFYIDGKLLITGTATSGLFNISTNSFEWTKTLFTNCGAKMAGDYFYTISTNYDNVYLSYPMIIKVSISTGLRDMTFPQSSQIWDAEPGNTFDVTPDGKVFATGGTAGYFFDGISWSSFSPAGPAHPPVYCSIDHQSSKIYISFVPYIGSFSGESYIAQYDYDGNGVVILNNLGSYSRPPQEFCVRNNVMMLISGDYWSQGATILRYNIVGTVATKDTLLPDVYAQTFNVNNEVINIADNKYILLARGGGSYICEPVYEPQKLYFFKYDLNANSYIDGVGDVYNNGDTGLVRGIKESPLLPGKLLLIQEYQIKECDKDTYPLSASQNGWPSVTSSINDALISGDYLYLCTSGDLNMSDALGGFSSKNIGRIHLVTKLIDRTYNPIHPSGVYSVRSVLSESDNYIYYNFATSGYGLGNNIVRISKTTNVAEVYNDLPSFYGPTMCRVATAADGSLIVMPLNGGAFSNRPYNIVDEVTLVSKSNQPEIIYSGPNQGGAVVTMAMHPTEKVLYAVVGPTSYGSGAGAFWLAKYNPVTITQQIVTYPNLGVLYTPIIFNPSNEPYIVVTGTISGKTIFGLKKINPNLTLS